MVQRGETKSPGKESHLPEQTLKQGHTRLMGRPGKGEIEMLTSFVCIQLCGHGTWKKVIWAFRVLYNLGRMLSATHLPPSGSFQHTCRSSIQVTVYRKSSGMLPSF